MNTDTHSKEAPHISELETNVAIGLTSEEAEKRLKKYGPNRLKDSEQKSFRNRIFGKVKEVLVIVLIAVAILSAIFSDGEGFERFRDPIIIILTAVVFVIVGFVRENKAYRAMAELRRSARGYVKVKRDGRLSNIESSDVVVGDIVLLEAGDCIPADLQLIETISMRVDESVITGVPRISKKNSYASVDIDAPLEDRPNIAYMGSFVTYGRGAGVVMSTGKSTELGKVKVKTSEKNNTTSLSQEKLRGFVKLLAVISLAVSVLVFVVGILYNFLGFGEYRGVIDMFKLLLALAVAVAPDNLILVMIMIISLGLKKMFKLNVMVKNFRAVEALGSTTVICTDKTGTLTENKMTVVRVVDPNAAYEVTGVGYKTKGLVVSDGIVSRNVALIAEIAVLCNDAILDKGNMQIFGDPTEGALLVFGAKLGHEKGPMNASYQRIHEIPFDCTRKMMSTYNVQFGKVIMNTKGAPETIINRCSGVYLDGEIVPMSEAIKKRLLAENEKYAAEALRVIAFAYKEYNTAEDIDNVEDDMIYVGMICLADPIRENNLLAIKKCHTAGISIKMITGDHRMTAWSVAKKLGLFTMENDEVLDGVEIDELDNEMLREKVKYVNVFANVTPVHKVRIVTALKENKNIVTLTGVNVADIPALKRADVGVAMGSTGTDAAREAADVMILDDSFASITTAIEQGGTIFDNVKKVIGYQLCISIAAIAVIAITIFIGLPSPLTVTQILLVSLLTTILPAYAMGIDKKEVDVITRKPSLPQKLLLSKKMVHSVIVRSSTILVGVLISYLYGFFIVGNGGELQHQVAMSMSFFTLVLCCLLFAYPSRSDESIGIGKFMLGNRFLNYSVLFSLIILASVMFIPAISSFFSITRLSFGQLILCVIIAVILTCGYELSKNAKAASQVNNDYE